MNLHYIPVYRQTYYEGCGFKAGHCSEAEQYYAEAFSLPMYPGLTEVQQDKVIEVLQQENINFFKSFSTGNVDTQLVLKAFETCSKIDCCINIYK